MQVSSVCADVTSVYFEAKEVRFGTQTPHLHSTKCKVGIFQIFEGLSYGVLGVAYTTMYNGMV